MWFWHVLALHLGCTVAELRSRMSRAEFRRWWQFHQRNPIDPIGMHIRPAALGAFYTAKYGMAKTSETFDDVFGLLVPPHPDDEAWSVFNAFL
ncbi:hypothetical protein LJR143_002181 [Pseudoxanthomonas sp. LjRoot143]|uniref:hypothetical protein n=1 Tax=Pseudoxanthomonas sp. LjRoot143 TaxID=3342266 RepID=UPI003ED000E0